MVEVRTPVLQGTIELRVVIVYRLDPSAVLDLLPAPFEALMVHDFAVGAISFSRLSDVRAQGLPSWLGVSGDHATHSYAVKWTDQRRPAVGVFTARRHTSSRLTAAFGDRLFPGAYERGAFAVELQGPDVHLALVSREPSCAVDATVRAGDELGASELFASTDDASQLFRRGAVGYSLRRKGGVLDGIEMRTRTWRLEPARVVHVRSSYFDDMTVFPSGSAVVDSAFVMRDIAADWRAAPSPITSKGGAWLR